VASPAEDGAGEAVEVKSGRVYAAASALLSSIASYSSALMLAETWRIVLASGASSAAATSAGVEGLQGSPRR
jgi:hypothetical protein